MKLKNIAVVVALLAGSVSVAQANTVTFTGSIIDAACSINPDDVDQTVNLGQISVKELASGGSSTPRNFSIRLENCDLSGLADGTVTTKFTGAASSSVPDTLGITGDAGNAGVVITNGDGAPIELGEETAAQALQNGDNTLLYSAYLKGAATEAAIPGQFTAVADYTLAYQ
ncbi:fimbrial protein [Pantoea endophytica]|uniref:Fimbrial protein n=1 Tax=Pantoea sp. BJ2 TaxID=3141322 RepID=A0AAU7TW02_9GAMM